MRYIGNILHVIFVIVIFDVVSSVAKYRIMNIEDPDLCSEITKRKIKLDDGDLSALIVKQTRLNEHSLAWSYNYNCNFKVKASRGDDGVVAVIQYISLRKNEATSECIDYVQFKAYNGRTSQKFCGRFNAELIMDSIFGPSDGLEALNNTFVDVGGELTTYLFVSRDALKEDEDMDLNIVYTTFKSCRNYLGDYEPCLERFRDICLYHDYFHDGIINCPYIDCVDEGGCTPKGVDDGKQSVGNKVLIASVTTLLSLFIIFIWCLCICRKYQKFCWAPQFANSDTPPPQAQPARVIELNESPTQSQGILPTVPAPPAENQEDKDLPPSYDSLFPPR